jgi:hypothetical protein
MGWVLLAVAAVPVPGVQLVGEWAETLEDFGLVIVFRDEAFVDLLTAALQVYVIEELVEVVQLLVNALLVRLDLRFYFSEIVSYHISHFRFVE